MGTDKLKSDLEKAKQKAAEWQAKVKDIERRITEQENLEIVRTVRSIHASPEELGEILTKIRSMKEIPERGGKKAADENSKKNEKEVTGQDEN